MRISVIGDNDTAKSLALNLRTQFNVVERAADYRIHVEESPTLDGVLLDSIDCPLEAEILRSIRKLTKSPVSIQTAGGNQSDRDVYITVSKLDEDRRAVEVGVFRGVCRFFKTPAARTSWIKRISTLFLLSAVGFGQSTTATYTDSSNRRITAGDFANNALRVNCVVGCGGGSGSSVDITAVGGNPVTTTLPVSGNVGITGSVAVTGTFWQATQPVSGTVTANQGGIWNITNISGTVSLPTGAATSALQTTGNTSLGNIETYTSRIPALGQALAAGSVPVVLTAAQLSTLTPLSSVTVSGTVTANAGTNLNTSLLALESGGNLATISTNTGRIPAQGQAAMAASMPVAIASNQSAIPVSQSGTWNIGTVTTLTGITNAVTVSQGTAANLLMTASQGGTWTVQPGNTANTTPWLTTISQGGNAATVSSGGKLAVEDSLTDTAPATQNITTQDSGSSTTSGANSQTIITGSPTAGSTANFAISGLDSLKVQVTGTWTGTLQSEISLDGGATWYINGIHQSGTAYTVATFTANMAGGLNVSGVTNWRMRATAAMTGTAVVKIVGTENTNSIYVANGLNIQDATTQSQKLVVDSTGALSANITRIGSNTVNVGNGTAANSLRVTLASDSTGIVAPSTAATWGIGATAGSVPANASYTGVVGKSAQPAAVTDGQLVGALASLDGAIYTRPGGPILWTCSLNSIAASLTQCQAAPGAGLSLYVTGLYVQTTTTTSGTYALQYGTGSNCGTGTTAFFPSSGTANRFNAPITTSAMAAIPFPVPIKVAANNALCLIGVATNTISAQIVGYTAP